MSVDDSGVPGTDQGPGRTDPGCVFCAIAAGRAEASLVHADDTVLAFMDIAPANPGHVLVIPRDHAASLAELTEPSAGKVWQVGHRVARALRQSGLRVEGVNLWLADGAAAGQEVPHVHLHVIPRYRGDGLRIEVDWQRPMRSELDANAALIGRALVQAGRTEPSTSSTT